MQYFVKSEVPRDKVDQFTRDVAEHKIRTPQGNISYVTPDGCIGYDIVECRDENDCREQYSDLVQHGLEIDEMTPIEPMEKFITTRTSK